MPSPAFTSFSKDATSLPLNSFKFLAEAVSIKRMLFENLRFRLMRAFASKEEYNANFINGVYQNTRKFLVKRITHFTNNGMTVAEDNLVNRTNLNREGEDNV